MDRDELARELGLLRPGPEHGCKRDPDDEGGVQPILIPWAVVFHGRRFLDLEDGEAPPVIQEWDKESKRLRSVMEGIVRRISGGTSPHRVWQALASLKPNWTPSITARNERRRFAYEYLSGMAGNIETDPDLIRDMELVLRPHFPDSASLLDEELLDPAVVPAEVFHALDRTICVEGWFAPQALSTRILCQRTPLVAVLDALAGLTR